MPVLSLSRFSGKEVFEKLSALENRFKALTVETADLSEPPLTEAPPSREPEPSQRAPDPSFDISKLSPEQKKIYEDMLFNL